MQVLVTRAEICKFLQEFTRCRRPQELRNKSKFCFVRACVRVKERERVRFQLQLCWGVCILKVEKGYPVKLGTVMIWVQRISVSTVRFGV